jgi:hypothetical protein
VQSRALSLITVAAAAAIVAGCAQVPQQTLHEAERSLEDARNAGAELYAFSKYKAAQVSLGLAKKEISEENKKLPFMRKYKKISETLNSAARAAKSAQAAVTAAKAQIRSETTAIILQTKLLADTVGVRLKKIPGTNIGTMPAELDSVTAALASADESLNADNLLAAKEKAAGAQAKITALAKSSEKLVPPRKIRARPRKR